MRNCLDGGLQVDETGSYEVIGDMDNMGTPILQLSVMNYSEQSQPLFVGQLLAKIVRIVQVKKKLRGIDWSG